MSLILNDWSQIIASAGWSIRAQHRVVSDGTYMYLSGGYFDDGGITKYSDVWRSSDGITWTELTPDGGFTPRSGHGFVYFNGYLYIFGGSDVSATMLGDVWRSRDGVTWTRIVETAAWAARHEFAVTEHNGKVYLTGGYSASFLGDTWYTTDMITWTAGATQFNLPLSRTYVREHVMASFLGKLWVFGGDANYYNNWISSSTAGLSWAYEGNADWNLRIEHQLVKDTDNSAVAIVGGRNAIAYKNDVWQTADGLNWTEIPQENAFTARSDFALVNHRGRTYIAGGYSGAAFINDVYASEYATYCDFSASPTSGNAALSVVFTSETTGSPTSFLWDFGDGATSTDENPTHEYALPGRYTVSLTVSGPNGSYTASKQNYIVVSSDFTGTPTSGQAPLRVSFSL